MKNNGDAKKSKNQKESSEALPSYLFHEGTNYRAYKYLGVHREDQSDGFSYTFRVWAPKAHKVSLVGDFTDWQTGLPLNRVTEQGVWELVLVTQDKIEGQKYKYKIYSDAGEHYKADPYATFGETLTHTASIIHTEDKFSWRDSAWLEKRREIASGKFFYSAPMNIYEIHLASWRTRDGKTNVNGDAYLNYREIADELVPYVKRLGYTHVELMPVTEHPFDGSWGYQCCGYFAPTSRFGSPEDFKYFINKLHTNGIGVIMDCVPAHFPKDEHGLYEFDGGCLYEYSGDDRKEHKEWGTRCFDVARNEVQCFLISSALFWLTEYHIDGLRVDAVASMLYLDYSRKAGEWNPNIYGGNESLESIAFFKKLNTVIFSQCPDVLMIAEESTAFPKITTPVSDGGLGFNFKWNMGWANDMYDYIACDPYFRKYCHEKLTFSMCYAYSENYILPVSHDEVVHGKKSLLDKNFGNYEQKFAGDRLFMAYQILHPGKKMTFMGCEFGQFREWDYQNQLEWFMTDFEMHAKLRHYVEKLNNFYLKNKELWENDVSWEGFEWIYPDLKEKNIIAFKRKDRSGSELVAVLNFSAAAINSFELPADAGSYSEVFNSDKEEFGGSGTVNKNPIRSRKGMIKIKLAPLTAVILRPKQDDESAGGSTTRKKAKKSEANPEKDADPSMSAVEISDTGSGKAPRRRSKSKSSG